MPKPNRKIDEAKLVTKAAIAVMTFEVLIKESGKTDSETFLSDDLFNVCWHVMWDLVESFGYEIPVILRARMTDENVDEISAVAQRMMTAFRSDWAIPAAIDACLEYKLASLAEKRKGEVGQ